MKYVEYEIVLRRSICLKDDDVRSTDEIIEQDLDTEWFKDAANREMFGPDEIQNIKVS